MTIGERIKQLRTAQGLTQEELAVAAHTTKQNIYKYEVGIITNIPASKIKMISDKLHTTPAYLMGWEENSDDKPSPISDSDLKFALFNGQDGITDEMLEEVRQFAEFVKNKK